jgi:hypothetical protein
MTETPRAAPPEERPGSERPGWLTWLLYILAGTAWIALSYRPPDEDVSDAEQTGQVIGSVVGSLLIALLLRLVYVKLLRRRAGLRFWSPWIFVIAAVIGVLARAGNAGE